MFILFFIGLVVSIVLALPDSEIKKDEHLKLDFTVLRQISKSKSVDNVKVASGSGYSNIQLANGDTFYAATVYVGSNQDKNIVILDTGSSDLWVMSNQVACSAQTNNKRSIEGFSPRQFTNQETSRNNNPCLQYGDFNPYASSSFAANSSDAPFKIQYGDGSTAQGIWGTDTVSLGSLTIPQCSLGVVTSTASNMGILGIGLPITESTDNYNPAGGQFTYQNFPQLLKQNGIINKVAYSLYLNEASSSSGSLLFGAVDSAKYSGQLQTVPLVNIYPKDYSSPVGFFVVVNSITFEGSTQQLSVDTSSVAMLLDSGTTVTHLPPAILGAVASALNGQFSNDYNLYEVSCAYISTSINMTYNFSGVQIRVPLSSLIVPDGSSCYLGLFPSANTDPAGFPEAVLGDDFLRNAYVVYDLEANEISLAQVQYNSNSNIEVISSTIPQAVKAPGYSSTSIVSSVPPQTVAPPTTSAAPYATTQGTNSLVNSVSASAYTNTLLVATSLTSAVVTSSPSSTLIEPTNTFGSAATTTAASGGSSSEACRSLYLAQSMLVLAACASLLFI